MRYPGFCFGILLLVILASCNKRLPDAAEDILEINLPQFGEENSLEIISWNIEQFPKHSRTIVNVRDIILDLDVDIIAVQEITSADDFDRLIDSLNTASIGAWEGRLSQLSTNLSTGIVFKTSIVTVESDTHLFVGDFDFAGRPPYVLSLSARNNNRLFDFTLIVLHLKAFEDTESRERRRRAIQKLESWIASQLQNSNNDPDYILAGDWNDELDDPAPDNVFLPFLTDTTRYLFSTEQFIDVAGEFTFIGGNFESLIDHIMITRSIDAAYPNHTAQVLKIDQTFLEYPEQVSDHRPIGVKYPAF